MPHPASNFLNTRDVQPEVMDQPGLDARLHRQALSALERINGLSRTGAVLWRAVRKLAAEARPRPLRILDVACGGGAVARSIAWHAARSGLPVEVQGCDISPLAIQFARESTPQDFRNVSFFERDVLAEGPPDGFDVITCTLFLHHLSMSQAERLLSGMAHAAGRLVLVDDLRRTRLGHVMAWAVSRCLTRSPVVRVDAPLSVRAAFTIRELQALAEKAGMAGATVSRHWPQRMLLSWERPLRDSPDTRFLAE